MKPITPFVLVVLCLVAFAPSPTDAAILSWYANLNGPSEFPPVPSPGTGFALVTMDTTAHTYTVFAEWRDLVLTGTGTTVSHIHAPITTPFDFTQTVGVATFPGTFPGFPVGTRSGTYNSPAPIDLTNTASYTAAFRNNFGGGTAAGSEAALISALDTGRAYFNIHSNSFPSGEIRGFLIPTPEPSSLVLFGAGIAGLFACARRRSRTGAAPAR
jgi:hypothetical protein